MRARRKGSFLVDALLGMMIFAIGVIPLIASITSAYGALTSSVEKRAKLDKIYSETNQDIVKFSVGDNPGFFGDFTHGNTPITLNGGHGEPPPYTLPLLAPTLRYKEVSFDVGGRDSRSVLRVYIVN